MRQDYDALAPSVDLVVLAQSSMMQALATTSAPNGGIAQRVLTSPELGIQYVADTLRDRSRQERDGV